MRNVLTIMQRELLGYFATPVAYVFIVIFLSVTGALTFYVAGFFQQEEIGLRSFFAFHIWLYLLLIPAVSMRLWAEERKTGSIELLMTLPITVTQAVLGKFLAAWLFAGSALALTFPMWITVNVLGTPDNGVIVASYVGSFLTAGAFLAIGSCMSALTKNQVEAFIIGAAACFVLTMAGDELVLEAVRSIGGPILAEAVGGLSFLQRMDSILQGVIDLRDVVFFGSMIWFWLFVTTLVVDLRKAA